MINRLFFDFGFSGPDAPVKGGFNGFVSGSHQNRKAFWTILIWVTLSLGIFLRRVVHFPEPADGINTQVFKCGILLASFIIGLAMLAPLLRIISRLNKGRLSWMHCLTAFSIGFFGDMTFNLILNLFVGVLK